MIQGGICTYEGGDIDIAKNVRLVEWLKSEILTSAASSSACWRGEKASQDALADCLASMIIAAYLLGKGWAFLFRLLKTRSRANSSWHY